MTDESKLWTETELDEIAIPLRPTFNQVCAYQIRAARRLNEATRDTAFTSSFIPMGLPMNAPGHSYERAVDAISDHVIARHRYVDRFQSPESE